MNLMKFPLVLYSIEMSVTDSVLGIVHTVHALLCRESYLNTSLRSLIVQHIYEYTCLI